jgi:pilus assembly protein CpaB
MMAIAPISRGEQITLTKLSYPKESGELADVTPVGKRAITLSVDNIASLAGMIQAGDYVDVITMLPVPVQSPDGKQTTQTAIVPLFQNVLVLAVGQEIGTVSREKGRYEKTEARRETSPLITVALTPQEASLIAFVQEQGKIRFVLRSPTDSQIEVVQPATWDTLFQYIMPKDKQVADSESAKKEELVSSLPVPSYVEIYRGLKKEKVPLTD